MERKIFETLIEWKSSTNMALVLKGPRQVGKTYIMKKLAKTYSSSVYINLENSDSLRDAFQSNVAEEIYERLSFSGLHFDFSKGKPLFIIDEIQSCSRAFSALKSLAIDGRCDIIASGSLLGVELSDGDYLSPMGYVQIESMGPMDFEEFLWAVGIDRDHTKKLRQWVNSCSEIDPSIHRAITGYFRKFLTVGGMPAAVQKYVETKDYTQVWKVLNSIYEIMSNDAQRYSDKNNKMKISACLESIPSQLARENKSFVFHDVEKLKGSGRKQYGSSLDWLSRTGIINICYNLKELSEPVLQMERRDSFKVYMVDSGILTHMFGIGTASAIDSGDTYVNEGAIMESCIAQALVSNGYKIHFYSKSNSELEMDFIISYKGHLTALEVKSGKKKKSKSLTTLLSGKYRIEKGIKVADSPVSVDEIGVMHLPLFAPCFFDPPALRFSPLEDPEKVSEMIRRA